jgi:hypothetical protein
VALESIQIASARRRRSSYLAWAVLTRSFAFADAVALSNGTCAR